MNISLTINDTDIQEKLRQLAARTSNMTACMQTIGQMYERRVMERFSSGKDPSGSKWEKLSDNYLKWKSKSIGRNAPILTLRSHLRGSIHHTPERHSVTIGTSGNIKYAAIHQFGKQGKMPARPYLAMNVGTNGLQLSDADKQMVIGIIEEYINR